MKDCLKKVYFLIISVFLFHCSMNMEDKVLLDKEQIATLIATKFRGDFLL